MNDGGREQGFTGLIEKVDICPFIERQGAWSNQEGWME